MSKLAEQLEASVLLECSKGVQEILRNSRLIQDQIAGVRQDIANLAARYAEQDNTSVPPAKGIFRCVICNENVVDPYDGIDTCKGCLEKRP